MASVLEAISSPKVQDKIVSILRTAAAEKLIVSVLKLSGIRAWILGLIADKIIDKGDEHLIEPLFRAFGFKGDETKGAIVYTRVKNAEDVDSWLDAVNDV